MQYIKLRYEVTESERQPINISEATHLQGHYDAWLNVACTILLLNSFIGYLQMYFYAIIGLRFVLGLGLAKFYVWQYFIMVKTDVGERMCLLNKTVF